MTGPAPDDDGRNGRPESTRIATSAGQLLVRRVVVQVLSALSTAVLARTLGVAGFGDFAAGLAMYYLALSVCDFGFGSVLARELGSGRADDGSLVRSMLRVQTTWSVAVGLGTVVFALAVGLTSPRIQVLLALTPAIALFGLSGVRQVFYASYRTGRLGLIDVVTNAVQLGIVTVVAVSGGGPLAVAVALCAMILVNCVVVAFVGLRLVDDDPSTAAVRRQMLTHSLPIGISSLLASAYFTLDLSIVGFLVSSREVGYYAAATKALSLLVTVPGLVIAASMSGLSSHAGDRVELGRLTAQVWHWLAVSALPLCVAVLLYAPVVVRIYYGRGYGAAVPLVRILALSGIVAVLSNVFGATMVATRRNRWLVVQGAVALCGNVVGNLLLVPRFGVTASAWLTVATEVGVCAGSAVGMRRTIDMGPVWRVTRAPLAAVAAMVVVGAATASWPVPSMVAAAVAFFAVLVALGGWPEDVPVPLLRRLALWPR